MSLGADPRSVGEARRFCADTLERWGADASLLSTCVLLASELATNAVLHARTPFTVTIEVRGRLRISIEDGDPRMPRPRDTSLDTVAGRGWHLVEALSRASGARPTGTGKCVWFELDWEGAPVPAEARSDDLARR